MLTMLLLTILFPAHNHASLAHTTVSSAATPNCRLGSPQNPIQHVIYLQFDNVHFTRDIPHVPSDLEQMPHLLNFIKQRGTLLTQHHTPLIAHTGTNILTSITGLYPDHHGVPVATSYRYFNQDGNSSSTPSFGYWTAPMSAHNATYNMLSAPATNTPAPWVAYTRAGCNFGSAYITNTTIEQPALTLPLIFGANSPEVNEARTNMAQATSDFTGLAIHCAHQSALCLTTHHGRPDVLPDEPGGYHGYMGLFGSKYIAPQIGTHGLLTDIHGHVITNRAGYSGFPGFNRLSAAVSLGYVAAMQEHGVPVTYAYIADVHDAHTGKQTAYGPGEAGYHKQLQADDDAFATFFTRLQRDGINTQNTLFVITADEGDHFVGGNPTLNNCDGLAIPCTYQHLGEINANLTGLLATEKQNTIPFAMHDDSAPTIYLNGNPKRTNPSARQFARALATLTVPDPLTGKTSRLTHYLADPVAMKALHMVTADHSRTPTFTLFAHPDYFLYAGAADCTQPCIKENARYAWNHGDIDPAINTTWLGMAGPGVRHLHIDSNIWSDHADIRPTMMTLLSLQDDYTCDGRPLFEILQPQLLPTRIRSHLASYVQLAQVYKQINAPVGTFGLTTLHISTIALASASPNDQTYTRLEKQLQTLTSIRDTLSTEIHKELMDTEARQKPSSNARLRLQTRAYRLLQRTQSLLKKNM
jgi:hypothetical protein